MWGKNEEQPQIALTVIPNVIGLIKHYMTHLKHCQSPTVHKCLAMIGWAYTIMILVSLYLGIPGYRNIINWCKPGINIHWRIYEKVQDNIKPFNGSSPVGIVNCQLLQDFQRLHHESETNGERKVSKILCYNLKEKLKDKPPININMSPSQRSSLLYRSKGPELVWEWTAVVDWELFLRELPNAQLILL